MFKFEAQAQSRCSPTQLSFTASSPTYSTTNSNICPLHALVCVSLRADDHMATLTVEDNGPGFDVEIGRHLFARRVKGRASRGHGLGLAFVEAVIRVHGGNVTATNRAEGGARLSIALPIWKADQEEISRPLALVNG